MGIIAKALNMTDLSECKWRPFYVEADQMKRT